MFSNERLNSIIASTARWSNWDMIKHFLGCFVLSWPFIFISAKFDSEIAGLIAMTIFSFCPLVQWWYVYSSSIELYRALPSEKKTYFNTQNLTITFLVLSVLFPVTLHMMMRSIRIDSLAFQNIFAIVCLGLLAFIIRMAAVQSKILLSSESDGIARFKDYLSTILSHFSGWGSIQSRTRAVLELNEKTTHNKV